MVYQLSRVMLIGIGLAALQTSASEAALICREPLAGGYEAEYARAHAVLPNSVTSDMGNVVIYAEKAHDGKMYFHSNFQTPGFDNPTKLADVGYDEVDDLQNAWSAIVFPPDDKPISSLQARQLSIYFKRTKLIVDLNLFDAEGRLPFRVDGLTKIEVVDHGAQKSLPADPLFIPGSPPPAWMVRAYGCCTYVRPPAQAGRLFSHLAAVPFRKADFHILSFVIDSSTEKALQNSSLPYDTLNIKQPIKDQLEAAFSRTSGKTLTVLGHVEDNEFVIYDARSVVRARIPIAELETLAHAHSVTLIEAGCNTAKQSQLTRNVIAIASRFNTIDAVEALDRAASNSNDFAAFLGNLSNPKLLTVIGKDELAELGIVKSAVFVSAGSEKHDAVSVGLIALSFSAALAADATASTPDDQQVKFDRGAQILEALKRALDNDKNKNK